MVPIEGRIALGEEPARARLILRREDAAVEIFSDAAGQFHGHVPGEGDWEISAFFRAHGAESFLGVRHVALPSDGSPVWLDLDLPNTLLCGRIVDSSGNGVASVSVSVLPRPKGERDRASRAVSGDEGWFWVWGLDEGTYLAHAIGPETAATSDEFEMLDGETSKVVVRLGDSRRIRGRVSTLSNPIAGAEVHVVPEVPANEMPGIVRTVTGPNGWFEDTVPVGTRAVYVTVLAPGEAALIARVPLPERGDLELAVEPVGGTLRLHEPGGRLVVGSRLRHGDAWTWLGTLLSWPALHGLTGGLGGDSLTLPMMEPGPYRFCSIDGERCAEGRLEAGGELDLSLAASRSLR